MNATDVRGLVERIQQRLVTLGQSRGVELQAVEEESRLEDDWLYVSVTAPAAGVRVSDYAELLAEVEKELRDEGIRNVLLVPSRP